MMRTVSWLRDKLLFWRHPSDVQLSDLVFDKNKVFKEEIQPFLDRATELCKKHDIPFLFWTITRCKERADGLTAEKSGYVRMKANDPVAIEMALFGNVASGDLPLKTMAQHIVDKLK